MARLNIGGAVNIEGLLGARKTRANVDTVKR